MVNNLTKIMISYLIKCPYISDSQLYFNFLEAEKDNAKQFISESTNVIGRFIDGSVEKRTAITILVYRSTSYNAISKRTSDNENIDKYNLVQKIIDWVKEQREKRNLPDFGENCLVEDINTVEESPEITGIQDTQGNPPLAVYAMTVIVDYIDYSKRI